jgi:hypothetical protein
VPRVTEDSRIDFLSGLVMVDSAMVALINISNLLSEITKISAERPAAH